jgi:hypothetical protein
MVHVRPVDREPENEKAWNRLIRDLTLGDCIPFLGAGASAGHLPLGDDVARRWAAEHDYPFNDPWNLARVMQSVTMIKNGGDATTTKRDFIRQEIISATLPEESASSPVHSVLARYPLPLYVTTNYDDLMYLALRRACRNPEWDLCPWYAEEPEDWAHSPFSGDDYWPSRERPLVFHLHGRFSEVRSLVLVEEDYLEFLVRLGQDRRHRGLSRDDGSRVTMIPDPVRTMLRTQPLLFIGYSLRDWTFQVLFRTLTARLASSQRRINVSIQVEPTDHPGLEREYLERYYGSQNIQILWESPRSFNEKLRAGLEAS